MKLIFSCILMFTILSFSGGIVYQCVDFWSDDNCEKKTITASSEDQEENDQEENNEEKSENEESEEEAVLRFQFAVFSDHSNETTFEKDLSFQDHFYSTHSLSEQSYPGTLFSPPELTI